MPRRSQRYKQQQQHKQNASFIGNTFPWKENISKHYLHTGQGLVKATFISNKNLWTNTRENISKIYLHTGQGFTKTTFFQFYVFLFLVMVSLMGQQNLLSKQSQSATAAAVSPPKLMWNSSNATVMSYATGYGVKTYKQFVGSLRNSGFKGHIILAVAPDMPSETENYLISRNVTYHRVQFVNCTYELFKEDEIPSRDDDERRRCMAPYTDLKARWGRFPLYRDYLEQCETCTGPVLVTDLRDTFFQQDPFGSGDPEPVGLQVFQEHNAMKTDHWIVDAFVGQCKGKNNTMPRKKQPMLCSGTTIGTRDAMLDYLDAMHTEMKLWMVTPSCHFQTSADDQAIHNYLYYTGQLPFAESVPNRMGIVHTIGYQASLIFDYQTAYGELHPDLETNEEAQKLAPLRTIRDKNQPWLAPQFDLTDEEGFILDFDGNRSRVVHQYDRFGPCAEIWLDDFSGLVDK